jgi:hypothetical protein
MSRKQIDELRKQRDALDQEINEALLQYVSKKASLSLGKRVKIMAKIVEYFVDGTTVSDWEYDEANPFKITVLLTSGNNKKYDIDQCISTLFPEYDVDCADIEPYRDDEDSYFFELTRPPTAIEIKGDLLDQRGYLVQQCNCVTVKAHGLSKAFIDRFGKKADLYGKRSRRSANKAQRPSTPGTYQIVPLNDDTIMVGIFGQWLPGKPNQWTHAYNDYTPTYDDSAINRLNYFKKALDKFAHELTCDDTPVYFPYRIGCGLAGGDWTKYKEAIDEFASTYHGKTYIVRLE